MRQLVIVCAVSIFGMSAYAGDPAPAAAPEMPSCGQVMAGKIPMVTKFADMMAGAAESMEAHAKWTGTKDKAAKAEHDAMMKLAKQHREMAATTKKIIEAMNKSKDLTPVKHDMATMDPKMTEMMTKMLATQKEFIALMQKDVELQERTMAQMKAPPTTTAAH